MQRQPGKPLLSSLTNANRIALELPPDRSFVLHLDVNAQPPRRIRGRVEHIASGRVAHFGSSRELLAFLAEILPRGAADSGKPPDGIEVRRRRRSGKSSHRVDPHGGEV